METVSFVSLLAVSCDQSLGVLLYPLTQKWKNTVKNVCLRPDGSQIFHGVKEHNLNM